MEPDQVFVESLEWLKEHYGDFRFFVERDLVWTLQEHLRGALASAKLPHHVFNDFPMLKGNRRSLCADLAVVDQNGGVAVAAEFKYEPDHARAGRALEIWPTKVDPSVVFWGEDGVLKDVLRIRDFVDQGKTPVAYSVFVDEGATFRHLPEHPGTKWRDWSCGGARPRSVSVLVGACRKG